MGINLKSEWENRTADELRELYEEKTAEDMNIIADLFVENETLKAVNREIKTINWSLTFMLFIFIMIVLIRSWFFVSGQ